MTQKQLSRAARAGAHHGFGIVCSATNTPETTPPALTLQLSFIARRIGAMDPATVSAIASLAFGEVAR